MNDKQTVLYYLWLYSPFHAISLRQSEELRLEEKGFSAVTVLFNCLENISKSVVNDYTSNSQTVFKKLFEVGIITENEHIFLNVGDNCIRKIRNLYAHANIAAINLINIEDGKEILWPLTEDETSLLLYDKVSDIIYNLILKCVSSNFIEEVKQRFLEPLDDVISQCDLRIKILSVQELLVLKGYPSDYLSNGLDIPEDAKYRLVDNASDVNMYQYILSGMKETGLVEALKRKRKPKND